MSNWVQQKKLEASDSFYIFDPEAISKFYGGFSAGMCIKKWATW